MLVHCGPFFVNFGKNIWTTIGLVLTFDLIINKGRKVEARNEIFNLQLWFFFFLDHVNKSLVQSYVILAIVTPMHQILNKSNELNVASHFM